MRSTATLYVEQLAYIIKSRFPRVFSQIGAIGRLVTTVCYGRRIRRARTQALVQGTVLGVPAYIRALSVGDLDKLHIFLGALPEEHLQFFRPHGFDTLTLRSVLRSSTYLSYGLFVRADLIGYALLKVAPTGSAYIGLLVAPDYTRLGLGKFLVQYLYWQASLVGLRARSTVSCKNRASLGSHRSAADFEVIASLPNDYLLIEFTTKNPMRPELCVACSSPKV